MTLFTMLPLLQSAPSLDDVLPATDGINFGLLLASLAVNLLAISVIMTVGYYRSQRDAGYLFTLVLVNVLVFLVTHLMLVADLSAGVGFGMFALFGIMRFRTATLPIKEMTYLFTAIVVAVINGVSVELLEAWELGLINLVAVVTVVGLSSWADAKPRTLSLLYDRIENLPPERRPELVADLEGRIGEPILDVTVTRVNLLNDTAELTVAVGAPGATMKRDRIDQRFARSRSTESASIPDDEPPEESRTNGTARTDRAPTGTSGQQAGLEQDARDPVIAVAERVGDSRVSESEPVENRLSDPPAPIARRRSDTDATPVGTPRPEVTGEPIDLDRQPSAATSVTAPEPTHLTRRPTRRPFDADATSPEPLTWQARHDQAADPGDDATVTAELNGAGPVEDGSQLRGSKRLLGWTVGNQ